MYCTYMCGIVFVRISFPNLVSNTRCRLHCNFFYMVTKNKPSLLRRNCPAIFQVNAQAYINYIYLLYGF